MKRILLCAIAVAALAFGGLLTSTAEAHGPYGYGCRPGHGHRGYGYGGYGYGPYTVGGPRFAPYGAGYSGGWQPYQNLYQGPRFGLYVW